VRRGCLRIGCFPVLVGIQTLGAAPVWAETLLDHRGSWLEAIIAKAQQRTRSPPAALPNAPLKGAAASLAVAAASAQSVLGQEESTEIPDKVHRRLAALITSVAEPLPEIQNSGFVRFIKCFAPKAAIPSAPPAGAERWSGTRRRLREIAKYSADSATLHAEHLFDVAVFAVQNIKAERCYWNGRCDA
jgi:hypothetical protein